MRFHVILKISTKISTMLITIFFLAIFVTTARSQCLSDNDASQVLNKNAITSLYKGQQNFSIALLDAINKSTWEEDIFFSPYSTYHALLLAYFGAKNRTEEGLKKILNLEWANGKYIVLQAYKIERLMRTYRSQNSVKFSTANKLFFAPKVNVRDCMTELFPDELQTLDFEKDPEAARLTINNWVQSSTRNIIKDILAPGALSAQTTAFMTNAAYFKGSFASAFDRSNTRIDIFYHSTDKQIAVPMMFHQGTFNYTVSEDLGAHVLQIPYEGHDISLVIFLTPLVSTAMNDLISKMTPETLQRTLNSLKPREVEVKMPKFHLKNKYELLPFLEFIKVGDLFYAKPNLEGFSTTGKIRLDSALHHAYIEVDESGGTRQENENSSEAQTKFHCNHPFLFLIYDHISEAILFFGIYRGFEPVTGLQDPNRIEPDKCGTLHPLGTLTGLVAGGETIARGTWPWLVAVYGYTGPTLSFRCGATIISQRLILSAAHCFYYKNGNRLRVRDTVVIVGKYSLRRLDEEGAKIVYPDNLFIHPDYRFHTPDADIAVIVTPESLEFSKFIRPICLWKASEAEDVTNRQGIAAGWGMDEEGNVFSDLPRRVSVPVVSNFVCRNAGQQYQLAITERTMCVGWRNGTTGVCQGDSGGGLAFEINGQWVLRGVVSTSPTANQGGSCNLNEYTIFTDISKFLDWIQSHNPSQTIQ